MKTLRLLSLLLVLFTLSAVHSQKKRNYKAWVTLTDESKVKGILYSVNEEGILVMDEGLLDTVAFLNSTEINILRLRKKGNIGKGAWIGAASGAIIGGIIGFADGDDTPGILSMKAEEKALAAGVGLAVPGTGVGIIIGSVRKKYDLKGNPKTYQNLVSELREYAMRSSEPNALEEIVEGIQTPKRVE